MDRRRESEVCESVRELEEFDEGGGRACRSWVSVCGVVGRGRGAPEKKWSSVQTKDALPRRTKDALFSEARPITDTVFLHLPSISGPGLLRLCEQIGPGVVRLREQMQYARCANARQASVRTSQTL